MNLLQSLLTGAAILAALPAAAAWLRVGRTLAGTTLLQAWAWSLVAAGAWWAVFATTTLAEVRYADQLWYLAAILALCPFLAALGAKRPMSRVWTAFVILPLVLALGWSAAASAWGHRARPDAWQLEAPAAIGYGLVLLMAAGNYMGTRFTGPVTLWAVSVVLVVLPLSPLAPEALVVHRALLRSGASLAVSVAAAWTGSLVGKGWRAAEPLSLAWREFRDVFGIVWARRIQDRMNELAVQHGWGVRLETDGFVQTSTARNQEPPSPEWSFRWLLRRFVSDSWLDTRLASRER